MARRPKGTQSFCFNSDASPAGLADQHLKTDGAGSPIPGILYSVNISWTGMTVDSTLRIHDTAQVAGDASATPKFVFRFPTAAGSFSARLPDVGKEFLNGLWLNGQLAGAYKLDLDIGFD